MAMDLGKQIETFTPQAGQVSLWWMHQAGFTVKIGTKTICLDLFLTDMAERVVPPIMKPEDLKGIDYVLGTHDHVDHIDRAVWPAIAEASPEAKFIVPQYHLEVMKRELGIDPARIIGVGNDTPFEDADGLRIEAVPSAHEFLEQDPVTGEYAAVGYVVSYQGFKLYHSGDCCIYEGLQTRLKALGQLDLMMLPITGRCGHRYRGNIIGNMTYQEAVDLAGMVKPKLVIPMHYNSYTGNLENPLLFLDYLHVKYPDVPGVILQPGERFDIDVR